MSVVYVVHKIYIVGEHPTLSRLLWAKFLVGKAPVDRVCIGPNSLCFPTSHGRGYMLHE